MWICSQLGFFSIVRKPDGFHIRARLKRDLDNLLAAAGMLERPVETPRADYRWRVLVGSRGLASVMAALEDSIDYANFKSRIHARSDQAEKGPAYGALWSSLYALQERREKG